LPAHELQLRERGDEDGRRIGLPGRDEPGRDASARVVTTRI
jgi:hypothetical protein